MISIIPFLLHHQIAATFAVCWVLSCAAESMPKPAPNSGPLYAWTFSFLHLIAGAIPRLVAVTFPAKYASIFNSSIQPPPDDPNAAK